jgi:hypothetical protein
MNGDPSYLPALAKMLASQMEERPWAQDVDWNNSAMKMLPGSGGTYVKRLIALAKQMMKRTPKAKRLKRQNARLRKKKRKEEESCRNKKKLIGILKTKAEQLWSGDLWSLNYSDFLLTPYWKIVREIKLRQANFSCERCGCGKCLQTHHKTYDHRGSEHLHLGDLEVLCDICHKRHHKIK